MTRKNTSSFKALAGEVARLVESRAFSATELRRAAWDLQTVHQRLARRQYRITSFGQNKFHIPDRAADFFAELKFHSDIGRSWAEAFRAVKISRFRKVADLCPGFGPKIELGLHYAGYTGKVTLIDKSRPALARLVAFAALFDPEMTFEVRVRDLSRHAKDRYGLVAANHLLDDLVIDRTCRQRGIAPGEIYASEKTLLDLWRDILANQRAVLDENAPRIASIFADVSAPGGTILFAQYKSYVERALALGGVSAFNRKLASRVVRELVDLGFTDVTPRLRATLKDVRGQLSARDFYCLEGRR